MDTERSKKVRSRVNRIAGQVAGIRRMVDEGRYCVEVLHQIAAARSALEALGVELLATHIESCVLGHGTGTEHAQARPMSPEQLVDEVRTLLTQLRK